MTNVVASLRYFSYLEVLSRFSECLKVPLRRIEIRLQKSKLPKLYTGK
jgi:hypothetical protein